MLDLVLVKSDCPVGIVLANGSRNIETVRQLYINRNSFTAVKLDSKIMLIGAIIYNMIIQMLLPFIYFNLL